MMVIVNLAQSRKSSHMMVNVNLAVMECKGMQEKRAGERKMMSP